MGKKARIADLLASPASLVIMSLGNPGRQYAKTRHSLGHIVLNGVIDQFRENRMLETHNLGKNKGMVSWFPGSHDLIFFESYSYMNVSSVALESYLKFHRDHIRTPKQLLVLHDELDLDLGKVVYKQPSMATNGHNGLRSIVARFKQYEPPFARIRLGIGRPESKEPAVVAKYVLSKFTPAEMDIINSQCIPETCDLIAEALNRS
ncbi:peptidyl-tRNA hydrolase [Trichomonascus vanleenenianus]|uniref:aminoacyl-tRNA hydrolase n=1 Tax=Trichomonascus vanleenenianus TaxID=2268995 RepID=UPI003EC9B31E